MIDIHFHFLFNVDDGPATIEGTMQMVEEAVSIGITNIVVTPHAYSSHYYVSKAEVQNQIGQIGDMIKARNINITLLTGKEVRIHEQLTKNLLN